MLQYWNQSVEEVKQEFGMREGGLFEQDVEKIRLEFGENVLKEQKKQSIVQIFLNQFLDFLVIILIIAAVISMFTGNIESTFVIFVALILNAVLGTLQQVKAQKSLESLQSLTYPEVKVIRDGKIKQIKSREVVPGDIVVIEAGDMVVADGRIIHNYSLQVNESSLTGESTNVEKTDEVLRGKVPLADRKNMVYSGSLVVYGRAEVIVTETGMNTELGKIAKLMNDTEERKTPLQVSLDKFSQKLASMIIIISIFVFLLCLYRRMPILDSLMFAVALAVAAIPEALGSIVTIVQAIGTRKMATENAIIKELKAVESLGCVSVICSDKTGTLTQNKMTVEDIYINGNVLKPEKLDIKQQTHRYLLYDAILTNTSSIVDGKGVGDPTEYALLEMIRKVRINEDEVLDENIIRQAMHKIGEIPFDSNRKLMSTKYIIHGVETVLTKGAVDILLDRCIGIDGENGVRKITDEDKERIQNQNELFSKKGLRVLAFAYKESDQELCVENENEFIFIGLCSMVDPPREESMIAVEEAKMAGIRPIMITGDHKATAVAIAKKIGIYEEGELAVTGAELDEMTKEELENKIDNISVYARVSPQNKIQIVEAWQEKDNIVAMTGDGVNDAPALKKADIGVAMGITGTEVSKDAASMILSDDNFATIIKAVTNGRNIYRNIQNAILFLLSGNMAGILAVLFTSIVGLPIPFAAVQLLFINLLTDSLPAIAIGMEPSDNSLLEEKPRDPSVGIITKEFIQILIWQGSLIAAVTMIAYCIGLKTDVKTASTMAFSTLTLARLFHGFNCRGKKSIVKLGICTNYYSIFAFMGGVALLGIVLFVQSLHPLLSIAPISLLMIFQIVGLSFIPTIFIQLIKIFISDEI